MKPSVTLFGGVPAGLVAELQARLGEFLREGAFIDGPWVERFESAAAERLGLSHAVGCANGTAALQLALRAARVGAGDEVITQANTYYATAWAIRSVGARPVFAEIDRSTGQIDAGRARALVGPRTRALLPVHLYGWAAPEAELRAISDRHGLALIVDAAHAFGSGPAGARLGRLADFVCCSFYPTKPLGAFGDAGLVATPGGEAAAELRRLRYFADASRSHFDPEALHVRLDALQAALLLVVLERFDELAARRRANARRYQARFGGAPELLLGLPGDEPCPYVFPIRVPDRGALLAACAARGIVLGVHHAIDLHRLPEFGGAPPGSLPRTEAHNASVTSLPVHPGLDEAEVDRVADQVLAVVRPDTARRGS